MGLFKSICHIIHLIGFSFILGNLIMDNIFGKRRLEEGQYSTIGWLYLGAWLSLIITGTTNIMLLIIEHRYKYTKVFGVWIKWLLIKAIITIIMAFFIESIIGLFTYGAQKKQIINITRTILFCLTFLLSHYTREMRENKLIPTISKQAHIDQQAKNKTQ